MNWGSGIGGLSKETLLLSYPGSLAGSEKWQKRYFLISPLQPSFSPFGGHFGTDSRKMDTIISEIPQFSFNPVIRGHFGAENGSI
jgi:hypothetical protein